MKLDEKLKTKIDSMHIIDLLWTVRFSRIGDPMMQDESGEYVIKRLSQLRDEPGGQEEYVSASKQIGW